MNPLRLVRTVLWGFLGLRKGREHERDLENMRPVPLILTGVTLAAGLVFCLLMVAKFVVASA
ncbi:alcohol dehydrogenase [Cupriavidus sp. UYMMa02A]|nr:alcohol dehydrogenase [Cupriavidus sp. UYMMa02A]